MNFRQMCEIEPELLRLEASAHNAGRHGADWMATWLAMTEPLSKIVGHGCINEQLRNAVAYEVARAALFAAWSKGSKSEPVDATTNDAGAFPWSVGMGTASDEVEQLEMFDTSEQYA